MKRAERSQSGLALEALASLVVASRCSCRTRGVLGQEDAGSVRTESVFGLRVEHSEGCPAMSEVGSADHPAGFILDVILEDDGEPPRKHLLERWFLYASSDFGRKEEVVSSSLPFEPRMEEDEDMMSLHSVGSSNISGGQRSATDVQARRRITLMTRSLMSLLAIVPFGGSLMPAEGLDVKVFVNMVSSMENLEQIERVTSLDWDVFKMTPVPLRDSSTIHVSVDFLRDPSFIPVLKEKRKVFTEHKRREDVPSTKTVSQVRDEEEDEMGPVLELERVTSEPRAIPSPNKKKGKSQDVTRTDLGTPEARSKSLLKRTEEVLSPFKSSATPPLHSSPWYRKGASMERRDESSDALADSLFAFGSNVTGENESGFNPRSLPSRLVELPSGKRYPSPSDQEMLSLSGSLSSLQHYFGSMGSVEGSWRGSRSALRSSKEESEDSPMRSSLSLPNRHQGGVSPFAPFKTRQSQSGRRQSGGPRQLKTRRQTDGHSSTQSFEMPWFIPADRVDDIANKFINKYSDLLSNPRSVSSDTDLPFGMMDDPLATHTSLTREPNKLASLEDFGEFCNLSSSTLGLPAGSKLACNQYFASIEDIDSELATLLTHRK